MIEIRVVDGAVEYRTKTSIDWQSNVVLAGDWSEWRRADYYGAAFTLAQERTLSVREGGAQLPPVADNPVITDGLLHQLGEARQLVRAQAERNAKLAADIERQAREIDRLARKSPRELQLESENAAQARELRKIANSAKRKNTILQHIRDVIYTAGLEDHFPGTLRAIEAELKRED